MYLAMVVEYKDVISTIEIYFLSWLHLKIRQLWIL